MRHFIEQHILIDLSFFVCQNKQIRSVSLVTELERQTVCRKFSFRLFYLTTFPYRAECTSVRSQQASFL